MKLLILIAVCVAVVVAMPREERFLHVPSRHQVYSYLKSTLTAGASIVACNAACDLAFPEGFFLCAPVCSEVVSDLAGK